MKKQPSKTIIKEFSNYFDQELHQILPILLLPDKSLVYKNLLIKQVDNSSWNLYNIDTKDLINEYFFKSCALIAAKEYHTRQYAKYHNIKDLDKKYATSLWDTEVFSHNLKLTTDDEKYEILLTRLEESKAQHRLYRTIILRLFRQSFI